MNDIIMLMIIEIIFQKILIKKNIKDLGNQINYKNELKRREKEEERKIFKR